MAHGTAYGLDYRGEHWTAHAACRFYPDQWFGTDAEDRRTAVHVCLQHCEVLEQCRRFDAGSGGGVVHNEVVIAGAAYNSRGNAVKVEPVTCSRCRPRPPSLQEHRRRQWREAKQRARERVA